MRAKRVTNAEVLAVLLQGFSDYLEGGDPQPMAFAPRALKYAWNAGTEVADRLPDKSDDALEQVQALVRAARAPVLKALQREREADL